jgi:phosphoribosylamine--glycine ligase
MKILVIGSGGREHALAWKLAQSQKVQCVYVAPGNGGTASDPRLQNIPITDLNALCEWAQSEGIALTVVGPEGPLSHGVVDLFRSKHMRIVGPTKAAAQLESSKAFSKAFMKRHNIPTATFETFSDPALAHAYVDQHGAPIVVKADGLAAGKGVVVALDLQEAHEAIDWMLTPDSGVVVHNEGGARVVIEEFLEGQEASFMVLCHELTALPLATSQDHKRLLDQDLGPNTGGMGAYSPAPIVTPEVHAKVMREIIRPTLEGMMKEGTPFTGFLYAGLMISSTGQVKTLEFNTRLGDPETQPIMMRLKNDWVDVLWASTEPSVPSEELSRAVHPLESIELLWDRRVALGVVLASHGYPQAVRTGDSIAHLPKEGEDAMVFHAGTIKEHNHWLTSGGRVLCVSALGGTLSLAQQKAYEVVKGIHFEGMQYRTDIGWRAKKGV